MKNFNSPESETAALKLVLTNPKNFDECDLEPSDFYCEVNGAIFEVGRELYHAKQPVDPVDVSLMVSRNRLEVPVERIVEIQQSFAHQTAFQRYCEQIKDMRRQRELVFLGQQVCMIAESIELTEVKEDQISQLFTSVEPTTDDMPEQCNAAIREFLHELDRRSEAKGLTGLPTGIDCLDDHTGGLQRTDLILLGARPSMGKTALAMNIAAHAAFRLQKPTVFFSLEMSNAQIIERGASAIGSINYSGIRKGQLQDSDWGLLSDAVHSMKDAPLYVDDTPGLHLNQIRARARALHRRYGIELIVIDYIQLIRNSGRSKNEEVGEISRSLKELAKELNIPILCLSQLSRDLENRADRRPRNSDLRDSGSLEQDADQIFFLYRDEIYNENTDNPGVAELICTKFRGGETKTLLLKSELQYQRFKTLETQTQIQPKRARFEY